MLKVNCCNILFNFLFVIKNVLRFFYNVQISTYYLKIILQFVVRSIALARPGTILPVVRKITIIETVLQTYTCMIKFGMRKMSIAGDFGKSNIMFE